MGCAASLQDMEGDADGPELSENVHVPIMVHVATFEGQPVVSRTRVMESIARANRELRPHGVLLYLQGVDYLREGYESVLQDGDRMDLAKVAPADNSLHVFFVDRVSVKMPRMGDRRVSGLHWEYHGARLDLRKRMYLVVASDAPQTTFVHEVGHAFGLDHRQRDKGNVMCSCDRTDEPRLDAAQGRELRIRAHQFNQQRGNYDVPY